MNCQRRNASSLTGTFALLFAICCGQAFAQASGGGYTVNKSVFAGGGGTSTNGTTQITGTAGQRATRTLSDGTNTITSGFWNGVTCMFTNSGDVITPATLPNGVAGQSYSQMLVGNGSIGPYTFLVTAGAVPNGMSLSSFGVLSGTPSALGTSNFTVTVVDVFGCTAMQNFSLTVGCPTVQVSNPPVSTGTPGVAFSQTFTQSGGGGNVTFSKTGTLPTGITFSTNGVLSGTTNQTGVFPIVVAATDANGCTGTGIAYPLTIYTSSMLTPPPIPEILHYKFDGTGTTVPNLASAPPAGAANATLMGSLTQGGGTDLCPATTGGTLIGTGGNGSSDYLNTGWATNLTGTSWTVSFKTSNISPNVAAFYMFGDTSANSFRCFAEGAAGNGNWLLRGNGMTDVLVRGAGTGVTTTTFVYDANANTIKAYVNGNHVNTVTQGALSFTGIGPFKVSGYGSNVGLPNGGRMDDFRIYSRALSELEVLSISNCIQNNAPAITPIAQTVSQGITQTLPIATVSDVETPVGSLVVTATTAPAGITITGITNTAGTITATVAADCTATPGANTVVLTVTDGNSETTTANLTVNVTANTAPTLTYAAASVTAGGATTNSPTTAMDNGSITGYSIFSVSPAMTVSPTVNSGGGVSITNAGAPGNHTITVRATDNCGATTNASFTLTVNCQTITVTNPVTTTGTVGAAFSQSFTQSGGIGTTTFSTTSTLPTGLTLSSTGMLNGTPTQTGTFNIAVKATDSNGCMGTGMAYTLVISCQAISVNPASLDSASSGTPFSQTFTQEGGNGAITWSLIGTVPPGLSFTAATATLSGMPTQSGSFSFTVRATDLGGCFGERQYALGINCATVIVSPLNAALPDGVAAQSYTQNFTASGGAQPHGFTTSLGNLPTGLTLSSGGLLSGTPTAFGNFSFTVRATDNNGCFGERAYTLVINPPCGTITVSPATLANGFVGTVYSQSLTASGGMAAYTFSLNSGTLPGGLILSSAGALTGTPTAQGTFSFTVKATDASGCAGTRNYSVIISGDGLVFYPLPRPVRLLDTRANAGNCDNVGTPIAGGSSLTTLARLTCEGILIPSTAQAITGNLTVINNTAQSGYLTIYPDGQAAPLAANMIYGPNGILSNNFTVGLSAAGNFNVFGERTIDVVIDVSGYYAPPSAGNLYYHPLSKPIRLLDTRPNQGNCDNVATPIAAGGSITTLARVTCEGLTIPAAAQALVGNATVINGSGQTGYLTIYPNGVAVPLAANMVYFPGQILSNAFTVSLNASGEFNIFGERQIEMAIDVAGYYSNEAMDANGAGLLLTALLRPLRILDTRPSAGNCDTVSTPITGGTSIATAGRLTCENLTIPATAQSILGNVTVINQTGTAGFLTLYPDGVAQPLAANMIYFPNQILSNAFVVGLNAGTGQFRIFAEQTLDAVVDASAYFAP